MKELHVAALPFPTQQGTQAAISAMLTALGENGFEPALLTYGAQGPGAVPPVPIHRVADRPSLRSFRSGPSLVKLQHDARLTVNLSGAKFDASRLFVSHHVEAALALVLARRRPHIFCAHTDVGEELPSYFPSKMSSLLSRSGATLDRFLCRRASRAAAISPMICRLLEKKGGRPVHYLPVPWKPSARYANASQEEAARSRARNDLGIAPDTSVVSYLGNLDSYQDWQGMLAALSVLCALDPTVVFLIASDSCPRHLWQRALEVGVGGNIIFCDGLSEKTRALVSAATDVAWVRRKVPGGLPIKLLDHLSRCVPVVLTETATAGLALPPSAVRVVSDCDAKEMAYRTLDLLRSKESRQMASAAGLRYLESAHSPAAFCKAWQRITGSLESCPDLNNIGPAPSKWAEPRGRSSVPKVSRLRNESYG